MNKRNTPRQSANQQAKEDSTVAREQILTSQKVANTISSGDFVHIMAQELDLSVLETVEIQSVLGVLGAVREGNLDSLNLQERTLLRKAFHIEEPNRAPRIH